MKRNKYGFLEATVEDYEKALDMIIELSIDADAFSLDGNYQNDEIRKCKLFREMLDVLNDVPASRIDWILDGGYEKMKPLLQKSGLQCY